MEGYDSYKTCDCKLIHIHIWDMLLELVVSVVYKGDASAVGWERDGNRQPGEEALQDVRTRKGLERRLQEIQQQLEILGRSQEMTVSSK